MIFAFDDCELDLGLLEIRKAGNAVHVEPQVFDVIAYLVQNHQRAVPKDELLDHIWPDHYISEAALNSRVMAARKAIGDNGKDQRLIKTIHGRGYRFVGQVTTSETAPVEPALPQVAPALEATRPAPNARRSVRGLELPVTSFIGREQELDRLLATLGTPNCRMLTVVGPGGVGKTRLAIEAARRKCDEGTDVAYVSVETVSNADQLLPVLAGAVGLSLRADGDEQELLDNLADRKMLLVVDNFEQLSAEGAGLLSQIAQSAPGVQLLLTSRIVLGLREEWVFPIGGLDVEGHGATAEAALLFLERQGQANASLGQADAEAVEEICQLTAGMPLAIELAAALSRYLSHREIADQIARDIEVLRADLRNVPERHRSVPGLLEQSVRHLTVDQMRALLSLSVFEGPFTAEAAARVADAPFATLAVLVDHSLVQPREGRFALHPLMRQFARDRLGDSIEDIREQHALYFVEFLGERRGDIEGGRQVEAGQELNRDFANLAAAWRWACDSSRMDLLERAAFPLMLFLQQRSRFVEATDLLRRAITAVDEAGPEHRALGAALNVHFAWARLQLGKPGEVFHAAMSAQRTYAETEAPIPRGMGNDPRTPLAVMNWGGGDYVRACDLASKAAEAARARDDKHAMAFALWLAGATRFRRVRITFDRQSDSYRPVDDEARAGVNEARAMVEEAAEILSGAGELWINSNVEIERGIHCAATGDGHSAQAHYERALELRRALGDEHGSGLALVNVADNLTALGLLDEAEERQREAMEIFRLVGDTGGMSEIERSMGQVALRRRDFASSREHFRKSLSIAAPMGYTNNTISGVRGMGEIWCEEEDERCLLVAAKVAEHEASTPFTRARAEAILVGADKRLVESARSWARERTLDDVVALVMED